MIKKIKFINLLPPTLAVWATIIFIIACGEGKVDNIEDDPDILNQIKIADSLLHNKFSSISVGKSSPSNSPYIVTCKVVIDTGSVDVAIPSTNRPVVECANKAKPDSVIKVLDSRNDVQWIDAPVWGFPEVGDYPSIK